MRIARCLLLVLAPLAGAAGLSQAQIAGGPEFEVAHAKCLGVPVETYRAAHNPTGGEARRPTKQEQKAQEAAGKVLGKIPQKQQEECSAAMVSFTAGRAMGMAPPATAAGSEPGRPKLGTEPVGLLSTDPAGDLKAGRTTVRGIDWIPNGASVSPGGAPSFQEAMETLAPALKEAGGVFRVDLYLNDPGIAGGQLKTLGKFRFQFVEATLRDLEPALKLKLGTVTADGEARLEFLR